MLFSGEAFHLQSYLGHSEAGRAIIQDLAGFLERVGSAGRLMEDSPSTRKLPFNILLRYHRSDFIHYVMDDETMLENMKSSGFLLEEGDPTPPLCISDMDIVHEDLKPPSFEYNTTIWTRRNQLPHLRLHLRAIL